MGLPGGGLNIQITFCLEFIKEILISVQKRWAYRKEIQYEIYWCTYIVHLLTIRDH